MDEKPAFELNPKRAASMRHRAERRMNSSGNIQKDSAGKDQKLIHELRVHQIELEMQNEELQGAMLELQKARDRYSDLYDFAPTGYFTLGEKSLILESNITFANLLGETKSSMLGKPLNRFIAREDQDQFYMHCRNCLGKEGRHACELKMKKADSTLFYVLLESVAKKDHDGSKVIRTAITNITARKQMEEELQSHRDHLEELIKKRTDDLKIANSRLLQAQKMEAVGTLTAGIAHDFNNILQTILGYTQILLIQVNSEQPWHSKLAEIEKAALRASDLVRRLMVYSRKAENKKKPLNLTKALYESINFLRQTIPKMIHIEQFQETKIHTIHSDFIQIEQIVLNLGFNSRDSMPEGGKLIFETKNVTLDETFCKVNPGTFPGDYVLIKVSDTGCGMDKETMEHIFEPFYTTKEKYKGAGLGLAMVYGIVKSHDGYITCCSEPGQGTTFSLYFPAAEKGNEKIAMQPEATQPEAAGELHGNETILLVDDEKALLDIGKQILGQFGYTTLTAETGEKAIECYHAKKNQIDLVILDLSMPGMGGYKCFKELIKHYPDIKVIIASGYSDGELVRSLFESGVLAFIGKPYQLTEFPKTVREVLDNKR
ncbi:MAG: response regulator [Desulfobacterales bacterium]